MGNAQPNNTQDVKIQGLIGRYLELRARGVGRNESNIHLDEDTLNAFTEGTLSEREAMPIVNHLADCSFCRHKTVELVQLDLAFADLDAPVEVREVAEPSSIASVLNSVLSRIFGSGEAAVFAHEDRSKENEDDEAKDETDTEDRP
jgi:hypothetical protein